MTPALESTLIRVAIVDDDREFRRLLAEFLDTAEDLVVAGEAVGGADVVDLCDRVHPDVVLMDIMMPGGDGVTATTALTASHPDIAVLALTVMADVPTIVAMLRAGARGYLLKSTSPTELAAHVRAVARGGGALSSAVARALVTDVAARPGLPLSPHSPLPRPTRAESEILDGLARGLSNAQMAEELFISMGAVKARLLSLSRKWEVSGRTRLLMTAVQGGYVGRPLSPHGVSASAV